MKPCQPSPREPAPSTSDDDAAERIRHLQRVVADWKRVDVMPGDLDRAIVLTGRASLALKFPDAIHIAIAERLDHPLLTSDRQQYRAARSLGLSPILPAISG
ncbi:MULTISPECIES: PIN domain-containing protein [Sphingomonas]|uniref:PIN domain-containing protein n=1 Tax=Sphingomonas TaxID=13687 RepID=UPI00115FC592|nr:MULTISPECIES: PIN domain-containing protein [Sphingomonas]